MITKETQYTKATDKKLTVTRDFDAPLAEVWDAWTRPEILDQWWAPKPWKARTKSMDFREGGQWLYAMEGPQGEVQWCRGDFKNVDPKISFSADSYFCDEAGNIKSDMPVMHWKNLFSAIGDETQVQVELTFESEEDMNRIIEMGFKEGFAMAHGNLDELLASR